MSHSAEHMSNGVGLAAVLDGILVVAVEQAIAAPFATSRLAEAGARVIKIERPPSGDFARHYDRVVHGECSHFLWVNRGKESAALDFKRPDEFALIRRIIDRADIFIQNLAPGAIERAGLDPIELRKNNPRLITCSISGYGDCPEYRGMRAYDNLVQAEAGIFAVTGNSSGSAKVGIPVCDIGAGTYAYMGILEALLERQRTGRGRHVAVSLFESMADWMTVPFLFQRYSGSVAQGTGLHHAGIAPYGAYAAGDGRPVMLSIQNDAEWVRFCSVVLVRPEIAKHSLYSTNPDRVQNRAALDQIIAKALAPLTREEFVARLQEAEIAYALIRSMAELVKHPALTMMEVDTPTGRAVVPRCAIPRTSLTTCKRVPAFGANTDAIWSEFAAEPSVAR